MSIKYAKSISYGQNRDTMIHKRVKKNEHPWVLLARKSFSCTAGPQIKGDNSYRQPLAAIAIVMALTSKLNVKQKRVIFFV